MLSINNYKLICWSIWLIGYVFIAFTLFFCHADSELWHHTYIFLFSTLFSSIPFIMLAIETKKAYEDKELNSSQKKFRFSEIIGAFVLTLLFAIWSFSASMNDGLNPAGFFWILGFGTIYIGYFVDGLIHDAFAK